MECESTAKEYKEVLLSGEELVARLATNFQTPGRVQYKVLENEQGQLVFPAPPSPTFLMATMDSLSRLRMNNTLGEVGVEEASAAAQLAFLSALRYDMSHVVFGDPAAIQASEAQRYRSKHIVGPTGVIVLAAGVRNNFVLAPAIAGYHVCIELVSIMSDTADTYTFTFQDADDVACDAGELTQAINIIVAAPNVSYPLYGLRGHNATVALAGEVDVAGGGGVEIIYLGYNIWYEVT